MIRRIRGALAQWLLPDGFRIADSAQLKIAGQNAGSLLLYAVSSGHLTRAYHAGRRVARLADSIINALAQAEVISWE